MSDWKNFNNNTQKSNSHLFRFEKHPLKKGTCPKCGHKNVFRYYEELSHEFGKCDRGI